MRGVMTKVSGLSIGRGLKLILLLQAALAVFLLATDVEGRWRIGLSPGDTTPSGPVSPGDQVRRYDPTRLAPQFTTPGTRPSISFPADLPPRLEFSVQEDSDLGRILIMHGGVEAGDVRRLDAYLSSLTDMPEIVAINSPGGMVAEALEIGRMLRGLEFDTTILPGTACLSSCPYILASGVERRVSSTGAVGLHQHYYETPGYMPVFLAVEDIQRSQGETMAYLIEMGVDPGVMVYGLNTPPNDIYVLVESELLESGLATELIE